ncbi:MAG: hypothetical protein WCI00_05055, partial [bacterium]
YDYKVRVYDSNNSSIYKEIIYYVNGNGNNNNNNNNNNSNGNLSNFSLTTDDSSPTTYQYVDLNITARDSSNYTISDFSDTVNFKVYYKSSNSSSWIQTTSSSYYAMASNYSSYGYSFSSYDNGIANLSNFIEFKNSSYDYKVRVYDSNNSSIYKEIIYYVNGNGNNNNNNSNINGFTSSELTTVEGIYNGRDDMISSLENTYSRLNNNAGRQTMSNNFKTAMQEIIDNDSNKTYDNFTDFYAAFLDWYRYTTSIR